MKHRTTGPSPSLSLPIAAAAAPPTCSTSPSALTALARVVEAHDGPMHSSSHCSMLWRARPSVD